MEHNNNTPNGSNDFERIDWAKLAAKVDFPVPHDDPAVNPNLDPAVDPGAEFFGEFDKAKERQRQMREQYQADDAKQMDDNPSTFELIAAQMEARSEATCILTDARRALLEATLNLNDAKARYEDAKVEAYVMGTITGKNAEEREARLAQLLEVQIHNVRRAEREWLKAKVEVECAVDTIHGMDAIDAHVFAALK